MSRRLVALALSLLLVLTQQWGTLHALSHGLAGQPAGSAAAGPTAAGPAAAVNARADARTDGATAADAGDALCQVCLVLAALGAAALPALWRWLGRAPQAAPPTARAPQPPVRPAPAPWHARAPPLTH